MFHAKLNEVHVLKKIVESIKDIVNLVNIDAGPNGLAFQAMDLSHVALVSLILRSDGFQQYRADKNFLLGMKLVNLHKILKCADNADIVTLECDDEPDQLHLRFESQRQDKFSKFSMNLVLQEEEQLQIPQTIYASRIIMPSSEFLRIVRELCQIAETVRITTSNKSIHFSVHGDFASGEMELRENNSERFNEQIRIEVDEPVTNIFSLTFLSAFTRAAALCESVRLYMSPNTPLVVEYLIGDFGSLKYYLAPKLNED